MYCRSTSGPSGEVTFCVSLSRVPNVLAKYLQPAWGVSSLSAARCLLMYCQSTNNLPGGVTPAFCASRSWFRLPNPSLRPAGFGLSSVDPAPEQVSSSRRATSFVAKCFQYTVKVPSIRLGKSLFVFTAKCHLLYCQVLSCEVTLVAVSKYLLGSASWFLLKELLLSVKPVSSSSYLPSHFSFHLRLYKCWGLINKIPTGWGEK